MRVKTIAAACSLLLVVFVFSLFYAAAVTNKITDEDRKYIGKILGDVRSSGPDSSYDEQIEFIKHVQLSVIEASPIPEAIPFNTRRGPKELYQSRKGICFDRSRVIEMALRDRGFEVRHIFILSTKDSNFLISLATPDTYSHAISEVRTSRGWLAIGSNTPWQALAKDGTPHSITDLKRHVDGQAHIDWLNEPTPIYSEIAPWRIVYGLHSRHGKFYEPYLPVPDVQLGEFCDNFY